MNPITEIVVAAIALGVIFFVPRVRRAVGAVTGVVISIVAIAVAAGGTALLMNNVTIFDSPGKLARIKHFLTVDWAATNHNGSGSVQCEFGWPGNPFVPPLEPDRRRLHPGPAPPRRRRSPARHQMKKISTPSSLLTAIRGFRAQSSSTTHSKPPARSADGRS